ncbi:PKD domain-containing protein [Candidatus Hydrogenedentota bacterium]
MSNYVLAIIAVLAVMMGMAQAQSVTNGDVESGEWATAQALGGGLTMDTASRDTATVHVGSASMKLVSDTGAGSGPEGYAEMAGAWTTLAGVSNGETVALDMYINFPDVVPVGDSAWLMFLVDQDDNGEVAPGGKDSGSETDPAGAWSTSLTGSGFAAGEWHKITYIFQVNDSSGDGQIKVGALVRTLGDSNPAPFTVYVDDLRALPVAAPKVSFRASPASGYVPLIVTFNATIDSWPPATSIKWDFGDDTTSAEEDPTHTYTTGGEFTATLTVNNAEGIGTATTTINTNALFLAPLGFTVGLGALIALGAAGARCIRRK